MEKFPGIKLHHKKRDGLMPERGTLSPFPESTQDISRLRNGNPYLKPEHSDLIELNFSKTHQYQSNYVYQQ